MTIDDKMRLVSFCPSVCCTCASIYIRVCVYVDFGSYVLSTLMYSGQNRAAICSTAAEPNKFPLSRFESFRLPAPVARLSFVYAIHAI